MRLNTCLHVMYIILAIGSMVFFALRFDFLGGLMFVIGFLLWCVLFSVESKNSGGNSD